MTPTFFVRLSLSFLLTIIPISYEQSDRHRACELFCGDDEYPGIDDDFDLFSEEDESGYPFENESELIDTFDSREYEVSSRSFLNPFGIAYTHQGGELIPKLGISRNGIPFSIFRGIPYARAPVGNLRFEPPQPHPGWSGFRDAKNFGSECLHILIDLVIGSEDCLFLNVYTITPYNKLELPFIKNRNLRPVMVFIHGGVFMFGGSNPYRAKYFLDEDIVLVTLNYRLASFGFLNTGDGMVQGNMALKDQVMALQWVQNNIRYFNGDKNRVTIFGESAGAACVHLHTLSPMSRGLFSGAISQSGTALSPWAIINEPEVQANELAFDLGCPTSDPYKMVQCLKSLPALEIAKYHGGYVQALTENKRSFYGPTIEFPHGGQVFLPASPQELLKAGQISRTPWITGVNSGEGLVQLIPFMRTERLRDTLNSNWDRLAPILFDFEDHYDRKAASAAIKKYYLDDQPLSEANLKSAVGLFSDRGWFLGNHYAAILQSAVAPTYTYHYNYQGIFSLANLLFTRTKIPLPNDFNYMVGAAIDWISALFGVKRTSDYGICHADELPLMFNMPFLRGEVNFLDADFQFSKKLIKLWVSFAEHGVPTTGSVQWHAVRETNPGLEDIPLKYLNIDKAFSIIEEPFYERMQFWRNFSNSLSNLIN